MPEHAHDGSGLGLLPLIPVVVAAVLYVGAARAEVRRGRRTWPRYRVVLWLAGTAALAAVLVGPGRQHGDPVAHTAAHLVAGMLVPILLVLAAPVTLALRSLDAVPARRLARLLSARPVRVLTHPLTALVIDSGSLWLLHLSPVGAAATTDPLLHAVVLAHFVLAGFLFASSVIGVDPSPHRAGPRLRLAALTLAVASHAILATVLYASAAPGSAEADAALLLYYGGDGIELGLIVVYFVQRYRATAPRPASGRVGPSSRARPRARRYPQVLHTLFETPFEGRERLGITGPRRRGASAGRGGRSAGPG